MKTLRGPCLVAVAVMLSCGLDGLSDQYLLCQASCFGCCTPEGACFAGESDLSCGRGGSVCRVCEGETVCRAGGCAPSGGGGGGGTPTPHGPGGGPGGGTATMAAPFQEPFLTTAHQPAPAMGGTLTVVDETLVVVSDPDRERVVVVDLAGRRVQGVVQLPAGSRPVRGVVDGSGVVHVVLRGTGRVLHLDPRAVTMEGAGVLGSDDVCAEPRSIAVDGAELLVACRSGDLVRFAPGGPRATTAVGEDLRDVLVRPSGPTVTTFRSAGLVDIEGGSVQKPAAPPALPLEPDVAWRTVEGPGGLYMLHQLASVAELTTTSAGIGPGGGGTYGGASPAGPDCSAAAVRPALTRFGAGGSVETVSLSTRFPGTAAGAVDLAIHPASQVSCPPVSSCQPLPVAAVVGPNGLHAYQLLGDQPLALGASSVRPCPEFHGDGGLVMSPFLLPFRTEHGDFSGVAFTPSGTLVAHDRGAGTVKVMSGDHQDDAIALFTDGVDSAGSRLFHAVHRGGAGISCAACHPEGGEDGHVWRVNGTVRRTQSLEGNVMARAPFHWAGEHATLTHLMGDTFAQRMGIEVPPGEFVDSLERWLDTLPAPRGKQVSADLVQAGHAAFIKAGCDACHGGAQLTTSVVADVGTGGRFKTPSLKGVSARGPWMHDGCARTLHERFIPRCGGSAHGNPGVLDATQRDALVAYLESL